MGALRSRDIGSEGTIDSLTFEGDELGGSWNTPNLLGGLLEERTGAVVLVDLGPECAFLHLPLQHVPHRVLLTKRVDLSEIVDLYFLLLI